MRSRPAATPFFATATLLAAALLAGCGSGISLDEPIEGPTWHLDQLGGEAVPRGADPRRDPQVRFDSSGRVAGSGGCNQLSGTFQRNGSALRLSQLASTRMACQDPAMGAKESQFFAALQATSSYRLPTPGQLSLLDASGNTIAMLSAPVR
jgi:heat shock protein HslJ